MTMIFLLLVIPLAVGIGVTAGRRRGVMIGIATCFGALVVGVAGYVGLLALALPM
jgi:hypothetical protein